MILFCIIKKNFKVFVKICQKMKKIKVFEFLYYWMMKNFLLSKLVLILRKRLENFQKKFKDELNGDEDLVICIVREFDFLQYLFVCVGNKWQI